MPRRSDTGVTIGVAGVGDVDEVTSKELLEDYINSPEVGGKAQFLFQLEEDTLGDALLDISDFAFRGDFDYRTVVKTGDDSNKKIKELVDASQKVYRHSDPDTRFLQVLEQSPNPVFFVLYDPDDELVVQQAVRAAGMGIPVHDLTDGCVELDFEVDGEVEEGVVHAAQIEEDAGAAAAASKDEPDNDEIDEEQGDEELPSALLEAMAEHHESMAAMLREHLEGAPDNGAEEDEELEPEEPEDEVEEEEEEEEEEEPPRRTRRTTTKKAPAKKAGATKRGRPPLPRDSKGNIVRSSKSAAKKAPATKKSAPSRTAGRRTGRRTRA